MTDPPAIYDPPRPKPGAAPAVIATVLFNIVALILLILGYFTAGEAFVGLAIVAGLVALFSGGKSTPAASGAATRTSGD
jgi:hypothetical protein